MKKIMEILKFTNGLVKRRHRVCMALSCIAEAVFAVLVLYVANEFLLVFGGLTSSSEATEISETYQKLYLYVAVLIVSFFVQIFSQYFSKMYQKRLLLSIKQAVYGKLLETKYSKITEFESAALNKRIEDDSDGVSGFATQVLTGLYGQMPQLIMVIIFCAMLFPILLGLSVAVAVVFIFIIAVMQSIVANLENKYRDVDAERFSAFSRSINNSVLVRTSQLETYEKQHQKNYSDRLIKCDSVLNKFSSATGACANSIVNLLLLTVFISSIRGVVAGTLVSAQIISMIYAFVALLTPVMNLLSLGSSFAAGKVSYERTLELMNLPKEADGEENISAIRSIECSDVTFGYTKDVNIVNHFSCGFRRGNIYFLKGSNGSGKSTILKLISRLYDEFEGEIMLNGQQEIRSTKRNSYYPLIRLIEQDDHMDVDDIIANVNYGHDIIPLEDAPEGLRSIYASLFALQEERKSDDTSDELSGGERKKAAILRGLLMNADVYLMDEPTNSLDMDSATQLFNYLKEIKTDKIIILAMHGDKWDMYADEIFEI